MKGWGTMKKQLIWKGFLTAASIAAMTFATMTTTVSAVSSRFGGSTTTRDANNNICINFEEVEVVLPADWAGKCRMVTSSDRVTFYHLGSNDMYRQEGIDTAGTLFAVNFSTDLSYTDNPDYMDIGETDEGYYYATFPTDVQAYTDDANVASEYFALYADIDWISENISLVYYGDDSAVWTDSDPSDEYIFPQSSDEYLTVADMEGMDADQIQMAINEIYARHGRKFVLEHVQEYFDALSWYEGTVEAADFDVNVMNQYEGANIGLMVKQMNAVKEQTN